MNADYKVQMYCLYCGSSSITGLATVRWNFDRQEWEVVGDLDCVNCANCGAEHERCREVPVL